MELWRRLTGVQIGPYEPMALATRDALRTGTATTFYAIPDGARPRPQASAMTLDVSGHGSPLDAVALGLATGRVLDVGAGAGRHALALQNRGMEVTAIEASAGLCEIMTERGVRSVLAQNFLNLKEGAWDTILLLFGSVGMAGRRVTLPPFFRHCAGFLSAGGQVLIEGSDDSIISHRGQRYSFIPNPENDNDPSERQVRLTYRHYEGAPFPWFWPGTRTIALAAAQAGLTFELLEQRYPGKYLVRMTR